MSGGCRRAGFCQKCSGRSCWHHTIQTAVAEAPRAIENGEVVGRWHWLLRRCVASHVREARGCGVESHGMCSRRCRHLHEMVGRDRVLILLHMGVNANATLLPSESEPWTIASRCSTSYAASGRALIGMKCVHCAIRLNSCFLHSLPLDHAARCPDRRAGRTKPNREPHLLTIPFRTVNLKTLETEPLQPRLLARRVT